MSKPEIAEEVSSRDATVETGMPPLGQFARRLERLGCVSKHQFVPGELICCSGDWLDHLHIVERGIVELSQLRDAADCSVLLLSAGDLVLPAAGLFNEPCLTSARAIVPVRTVALEIKAVRAEARSDPSVAMELSRAIAGQWRMAVRHILDLKCRSVPQRLASFLLRLVDEGLLPDEAELSFSKRALAARIGASPETLSRAIQTVANEGLVLQGRRIVVRDRRRIEWFCEGNPYPGGDEKTLEVHAF